MICYSIFLYSLQVPVQLPLISSLSKLRISIPPDLRPIDARQSILLAVQELERRFPQGLPKLNPVKVCYGFLSSYKFLLFISLVMLPFV